MKTRGKPGESEERWAWRNPARRISPVNDMAAVKDMAAAKDMTAVRGARALQAGGYRTGDNHCWR